MRRLLLSFLVASLAACTLSLPAKTPEPAPAAILPGAVEVTPLAAPATAERPAEPATEAQSPAPAAQPAAASNPDLAPAPAPTESRTPQERACLAKGGIWSANGTSSLRTCVERTRDAGKSCRKETDCEGLCLARSRSCAPVKPLFGCNPILQADGSEATLCID